LLLYLVRHLRQRGICHPCANHHPDNKRYSDVQPSANAAGAPGRWLQVGEVLHHAGGCGRVMGCHFLTTFPRLEFFTVLLIAARTFSNASMAALSRNTAISASVNSKVVHRSSHASHCLRLRIVIAP